jgi:hypothetical protein
MFKFDANVASAKGLLLQGFNQLVQAQQQDSTINHNGRKSAYPGLPRCMG